MLKSVFRMICAGIFGIAVALLLRFFVVERYVVPTGSMEPTISVNDSLLGEKVTYRFEDVAVGDIVTFMSPETPGMILVKRVIATGGSTVDIKDGQVYVDGVKSEYGHGKTTELENEHNIKYPYVVPQGYVWCMGDNREHSADARVFGAVPVESVQARIFCVLFPQEHARMF